MQPFDPESGEFAPALESIFARPPATIPAVLLLATPDARRDGWAARAAVALAGRWVRRRPAITLAALAPGAPDLADLVGADAGEGLSDIFEFGISLARATRKAEGHEFRVLSSGLYVPDTEALLTHARWHRLIGQFAEDQATLLIYVPSDSPGLDVLARRVGKAIILAAADEAATVAEALPSSCSILIGLHRTDDVPVGTEEAEETSAEPAARGGAPPVDPVAGSPVRERDAITEPGFIVRQPPARRRVSPVLWVLLVVALGLGGWVVARRYLDGAAARAESPPPTAPQEQAAAQPREPVLTPVPYSVAVEAHPDFDRALERVRSLQAAEPQIPFFLAPILYDSIIYYRVLAGLLPDTSTASVLNRRLFEAGHKTDADAWTVRPTIWAFHLDDFDSREAAEARSEALMELGIPTYVVEVPYTVGPARYRLYAGAYEGPAQGGVMTRLLEEAGVPARLVQRMGPRPPAE